MNKNRPSEGDVEMQEVTVLEYPSWWTRARVIRILGLSRDDTIWNSTLCLTALAALVWVYVDSKIKWMYLLDQFYNLLYAVHFGIIAYGVFITQEVKSIKTWTLIGFAIDVASYLHYVVKISSKYRFKLICYYCRMHRPFEYLWRDNYKVSIIGTTLEYMYIFFFLRVTWAHVYLWVDEYEKENPVYRVLNRATLADGGPTVDKGSKFLRVFYIINKMFVPIGPSEAPVNDMERILCLLVMLSGCLVVTGAAVASLSLVISIYLRTEEVFRSRYRLIMEEMKELNVPPSLRERVESFYKMYWHKQKAVSATRLLPTYPHTVATTVYTDIYFEAIQKSRVLRDLSYPFISELAKRMQTIHYIPGDPIIIRNTRKSTFNYVAYGDVEMLSAEDDSTAILRMTRGTAVAGCAGGAAAACARALVQLRAATFCTTHALRTRDLWRVVLKYGRHTQAHVILDAFNVHLNRVKIHYEIKMPEDVLHKSSILHFKRNLMTLKEAKDADGNMLLARNDVFLQIAGTYIQRNRADAAQADESDAICLRPTFPYILQPGSSLLMAWNLFITAVIVLVCFTHPYFMVFTKTVPTVFRFSDYMVTMVFVLDLITHLSTGENVEEGVPITFAQTSSQQMRSHWFVLDVVATLPIFEFIHDGHFAGMNKLLRLPKVFRVLKSLEELSVYHGHIVRFLTYTLLLVIACYLIAALQQGIMCFQFDYCLVSNFTHPPYWESSKLDDQDVMHRILFGLYWAISMITFTTHMETWGTYQWHSTLNTICMLEVCIVLHIFIEAVYSATIMVTTALREDYDSCIGNVKDFLIRNDVDPLLRTRFTNYLQLCWYTDEAYSMVNKKSSIFHDLPPHVYQDIVTRQRNKYLLCIPFMKFLNKEDLKAVSTAARLFYTSPNEILLNTGDISNEMYVIRRGTCEIWDPETKQVVGSLTVKQHFGVLECLLRFPAYFTVRALTHVHVFSIPKKELTKALELPQLKDAIDFAKEQEEYSQLLLCREPFLSYQPPERTPNMERFRPPRKFEADYVFLHPFTRLGFFSALRYIFPRFTIRPDGDYMGRYEWYRAVCALASIMVFPSYTYLGTYFTSLYYLTWLLDISAYFDLLQRMLVGYFTSQGILVYHPVSTAAHYLRGAFLIDLFACVPLETLATNNQEYDGLALMNKYVQLLMMNRMIQYYRVPGALVSLEKYFERRDVMLVLKAIPLFLLIVNLLTSFIVMESVLIFSSSTAWRVLPYPNYTNSWTVLFDKSFRFNITENPWNMHLATFFWVVYETTTTGYGIFRPSNTEIIFKLFVGMVISAMITTYFSVRIISIRANVNKNLAAYQEHMKDIIAFMKRENLQDDLQKEVREYLEYNWEKTGGVDYTSVLHLCEQIPLRTDAIIHIYGVTFEKCPFLADCDVSVLRLIGREIRSTYFLPNMPVILVDDVIGHLYFVDHGVVTVTHVDETNTKVSVDLARGSVFGNLDNVANIRCPTMVVAQTRVQVLKISAVAFYQIINGIPHVLKKMEAHRNENQNYIVGTKDEATSLSKAVQPSRDIFGSRQGILKFLYYRGRFIQLYFIIVSLSVIYADVYNAGFQDNSTDLIIALYVLDICFYFKILLHFLLPTVVAGKFKRSLTLIREGYFQVEFKYDVMSCMPIELACFFFNENKLKVFSCLRLNRMFRIITVYKCLKRQKQRVTMNLTMSMILSVVIWFTLFVHTTASLWFFIGTLEDRAAPKSSWKHKDDGKSWCQHLYTCSLYFVLTTFTQNGVGDIMPKKHAEVVFVSILQIISTMVCMIYVGEISNIIQFRSFRSFGFYCKYLELQEFLKNNRVSRNLVALVNRYTLHLWHEARGTQLPYFLEAAPSALRLRVMHAAYSRHLTANPVFKECEHAFLRQLVGCFQLFHYNEEMYVVKEMEITNSMYMIHTGKVQEEDAEGTQKRRYLGEKECFGIEQGLIHDNPYTFSYRSTGKSQVLTLRLDDWEFLLEHFPECKKAIYKNFKPDDSSDQSPKRSKNERYETSSNEHSIDEDKPDDPSSKTKLLSQDPMPPTTHHDQNYGSKSMLSRSNLKTADMKPNTSARDLDTNFNKDSILHNVKTTSNANFNKAQSEHVDKFQNDGKHNLFFDLEPIVINPNSPTTSTGVDDKSIKTIKSSQNIESETVAQTIVSDILSYISILHSHSENSSDEARTVRHTFLEKVTSKVKQSLGMKNSDDSVPKKSDDSLQFQEEEVATSALLGEFEKLHLQPRVSSFRESINLGNSIPIQDDSHAQIPLRTDTETGLLLTETSVIKSALLSVDQREDEISLDGYSQGSSRGVKSDSTHTSEKETSDSEESGSTKKTLKRKKRQKRLSKKVSISDQ